MTEKDFESLVYIDEAFIVSQVEHEGGVYYLYRRVVDTLYLCYKTKDIINLVNEMGRLRSILVM